MNRVGILVATVLALSVVDASADNIKIGILAPLSGGAAADGDEMVKGARLAIEEVNSAGGVNGQNLELVIGDVKGQTSDAVVSAVERMIGENVDVVLSGYATQNNFEIDYLAEAGLIYLVAGNSAQTREFLKKDPERYRLVWSYVPSFDAYETELLPAIDRLVADGKLDLPNKNLAILTSDNAYSKAIYDGLKANFSKAGWNISVDEVVPSGEINDWRSLLAKVRQDPPAVIVNTDWVPSNAATFMSQFMENPTNSLVFIQYGPSVPEFIDLTKANSTGVLYNLLGGPLYSDQNPRAFEVSKKYQSAYGVEPGLYGSALYEMTHIYVDALARAKDRRNVEEISKVIGATDKQTAIGHLVFDPETHLAKQGDDFVPIQFYQIWEGKRSLFYPGAYATGDFQTPPWMKK